MNKPDNTLPVDAYRRLLAQQEADEKRRLARKKSSHQESTLQRACVAWFRAEFPDHALMLFAVPNGGGRSRVEGAIMKGEGVTAGVSDLILLEARGDYGALCIELKTTRKTSRQSDDQKRWQKAAEAHGNRYVVIRTEEQFKAVIYQYLALKRK